MSSPVDRDDVPEADAIEQQRPLVVEEAAAVPDASTVEADEADLIEQATDVPDLGLDDVDGR